ncbi:hypothetical protein [Bacillus pseudomycoides]|uniref:hypothetical protein n=1 Tax=Bacillus pseudomycoides TaxID=64104 RepID=UPI000BFBC280|nr:hypothetical protein [Bacillus pseudomycoides]PHA96009.1 hypothetical protein COE78_07480 [Bacillus pseudomycoides]
MVTPQAVYYSSYFYEHSNFGGSSFGASSNISWMGSYWNDKISSLTATGQFCVGILTTEEQDSGCNPVSMSAMSGQLGMIRHLLSSLLIRLKK